MLNKPKLDFRKELLSAWTRLSGKARPSRAAKKSKPPLPAAVYEVQAGFVVGARLSRGRHKVSRLTVREFDPEGIEAVSCLSNVSKPEELLTTLQGMEAALGSARGPLALLLPDPLVRVSILEFETLPADARDQEALVRWKLKPLLPFPSEEARLSFEVTHQEEGRVEVLALAARNSVVAGYESILEALNGEVKVVLPASLALLPLLNAESEQGELLLHIWPGGLTALELAGGRLRLWRSQSLRWTSPGECLRVVSQEAARMLAGAQDHLKLEIGRVSLCVRPPVPEEWTSELARAIGREVQPLNAADAAASGFSTEQTELLQYFGAPLAGLLANAS